MDGSAAGKGPVGDLVMLVAGSGKRATLKRVFRGALFIRKLNILTLAGHTA